MFTENHQTNRISPVRTKKISELGFTERKHLYKWLALLPNVRSEELLTIQKEDCFDNNREQLDLLAVNEDVLNKEAYDHG